MGRQSRNRPADPFSSAHQRRAAAQRVDCGWRHDPVQSEVQANIGERQKLCYSVGEPSVLRSVSIARSMPALARSYPTMSAKMVSDCAVSAVSVSRSRGRA